LWIVRTTLIPQQVGAVSNNCPTLHSISDLNSSVLLSLSLWSFGFL
jgi:hypothetical protein